MTQPTPHPAPPEIPPTDLKDYRQPLVTSLGVFLGFLVGFMGQWITEDHFALVTHGDQMTFWGCSVSVVLLLLALFRMLTPGIGPQDATAFYRRTLALYIGGVTAAFASLVLAAFL